MTFDAGKVLAIAERELGYVESGGRDGRSGNVTKYWAELDPALQGNPWCAAFVSWVFKHAGCPLPEIDKPYGYTFVPSLVRWAQSNGRIVNDPRPGDVIAYRINSNVANHTGIVKRVLDPDHFVAIEGNTSAGETGSQVNGGGVYERNRTRAVVACFVRPFSEARVPDSSVVKANAPVVRLLTHPAWGPDAYLIVCADGGVFTFGGAPFYGSAGAIKLNAPIKDAAVTGGGHGYRLMGADGGIFCYGDATYKGRVDAPVAS